MNGQTEGQDAGAAPRRASSAGSRPQPQAHQAQNGGATPAGTGLRRPSATGAPRLAAPRPVHASAAARGPRLVRPADSRSAAATTTNIEAAARSSAPTNQIEVSPEDVNGLISNMIETGGLLNRKRPRTPTDQPPRRAQPVVSGVLGSGACEYRNGPFSMSRLEHFAQLARSLDHQGDNRAQAVLAHRQEPERQANVDRVMSEVRESTLATWAPYLLSRYDNFVLMAYPSSVVATGAGSAVGHGGVQPGGHHSNGGLGKMMGIGSANAPLDLTAIVLGDDGAG